MEGDCDSRYCRFLCRVQKFTSTIGILRSYTPHGVYCDIHCGGQIPNEVEFVDWTGLDWGIMMPMMMRKIIVHDPAHNFKKIPMGR